MESPKILAVIPAIAELKGVPNMNIQVSEKPLTGNKLETATNSKLFDYPLVSSDSDEIASVAEHFGTIAPLRRQEKLSIYSALYLSAIQHTDQLILLNEAY